MLDAAAAKNYNELCERHKTDYTQLFGRVKLQLNPHAPMTLQYPAVTDLPTHQRLARYRKGNPDYRLEEIYYQFGRYLLIASSRPGNLPANLQGMWANGVDGPWHVDYHNNINIQMNYWPACSTNLNECVWPLIDFIRWTENGNIDTFMEMIDFMVEDDKRMKEMGERGYRFLCENYTDRKSVV